jgi:outer membrane biosynthesis protein TonB
MSPFFSNKMKNNTHATLVRVVYHTILKQHDAVIAAAHLAHSNLAQVLSKPSRAARPAPKVEKEPVVEVVETPVSEPDPTPPVGPPSLTEQMVDKTEKPKRVIKLDL